MNKHKNSTREALLDAGLRLFGTFGFDATSTRQIAQAAGVNISAISYHFGGKDALRLACAEHVAEKLTAATKARLVAAEDMTPEEAALRLEHILSGLVQMLLLHPQAREMAQFMLREVAQSADVLDIVFPKSFEPVHKLACRLWARATGQDAENEVVMLSVFTLVGQVVYFRIGQEIIRRRMNWNRVGPAEVQAIENVIRSNLRATLDIAKKGSAR